MHFIWRGSISFDVYVSDSCLAPEIRGDRAFAIHTSVYNQKDYDVKNVKAAITFENPKCIEMLDDFYTTELTKTVDELIAGESCTFDWDIRVKDGFDLSNVKYTVKVSADEFRDNTTANVIDYEGMNYIDFECEVDNNYRFYQRQLKYTIKYKNAKTIDVVIKNLDSKTVYCNSVTNIESFGVYHNDQPIFLLTDNTYYIEVIINKGKNDERVLNKTLEVNSVGEYKILYQTNRRPGLAKDEDGIAIEGKTADDLLYNDCTAEDLMSIESGTVFTQEDIDKSDEELFETFSQWMKLMTQGNVDNIVIPVLTVRFPVLGVGLRCMNYDFSNNGEEYIMALVNHFKYGNGENFRNQYLTEAVKNHHSTQEYVDYMIGQIKKKLNETNGDITVITPDYWKAESSEMDLPNSLNYSDVIDNWEGLALSIHDVWATDLSIKDYSFDGKNYKGTIKLTLYDHFGLNELDIDNSKDLIYIKDYGFVKANSIPLFRAWYLLQHNEKYGGKYKPFITVVELEYPFEGSVE